MNCHALFRSKSFCFRAHFIDYDKETLLALLKSYTSTLKELYKEDFNYETYSSYTCKERVII